MLLYSLGYAPVREPPEKMALWNQYTSFVALGKLLPVGNRQVVGWASNKSLCLDSSHAGVTSRPEHIIEQWNIFLRIGQNGLQTNLLFYVKVDSCQAMCICVENFICLCRDPTEGHNGHWAGLSISTRIQPKLKMWYHFVGISQTMNSFITLVMCYIPRHISHI